jgi:hypothetical protein
MEIDLNEIINALKLVESKLEAEENLVSIDTDNYWIISASEWDDFSKDPAPSVGSLQDDLEAVKKALKRGAIVSYSEVDSLASILRAISEKIAPVNWDKS